MHDLENTIYTFDIYKFIGLDIIIASLNLLVIYFDMVKSLSFRKLYTLHVTLGGIIPA